MVNKRVFLLSPAPVMLWALTACLGETPGPSSAEMPGTRTQTSAAAPAQVAIDQFHRGLKALKAGRHDEAVRHFTVAIQSGRLSREDLAVAFRSRALACRCTGRYTPAIADYGKAIELNPKDADAYAGRGYVYAAKRVPPSPVVRTDGVVTNQRKAVNDYTKAIELRPGDARLHYDRGSLFAAASEYDKAIEDFDRAIKIKPKYIDAYFSRAAVYRLKSPSLWLADSLEALLANHRKAIAGYSTVIKLDPGNARAYYLRCRAQAYLRDYTPAISDYLKLMELDTDLAREINNTDVLQGAVEHYSRIIKANPKDAMAYLRRGIAYHGQIQERKKAPSDYSKAIELAPKLVQAYRLRAEVRRSLDEYEGAIRDCDKAIELDPTNASNYRLRAGMLRTKGNYDKAIADFSRAIDMSPGQDYLHRWRGSLYYTMGLYDKAIADLSRTIELTPESSFYYSRRGYYYLVVLQYDKAVADFSRAIDIGNDSRRYLARYHQLRGRAYREKGQHDKAIADCDKAVDISWSARAYMSRGHAYNAKGHWLCIYDYDSAAAKDTADLYAPIWRHVARERLGKRKEGELAKTAAERMKDASKWPAPVIRMYLGKLSPAQCLAAAASTDKDTASVQKCEAYYFIGEYYFIKGQTKQAMDGFARCVSMQVRDDVVSSFARQRLSKLGK